MAGSGWGGGRQSGCERRIEVFVKIQKKKNWGGGVRGRGQVWGVRVDVIVELKSFFFLGGGVRVDVNEELKFFLQIQKKKKIGGGGGVRGVGFGGGLGWMRTKIGGGEGGVTGWMRTKN